MPGTADQGQLHTLTFLELVLEERTHFRCSNKRSPEQSLLKASLDRRREAFGMLCEPDGLSRCSGGSFPQPPTEASEEEPEHSPQVHVSADTPL